MRPIMNIFSPVSGWNADSYIFLALHTCSSVVPTGSFLCLLVKKNNNNHTATGVWKSRKPESGIGTGIRTGTGSGTGTGTGMGTETFIKTGTAFTLI